MLNLAEIWMAFAYSIHKFITWGISDTVSCSNGHLFVSLTLHFTEQNSVKEWLKYHFVKRENWNLPTMKIKYFSFTQRWK